jgi:hypothetical protein
MNCKYFYYFTIAVSLVFLNSCDDFFKDDLVIKIDKGTFEKERALWNSSNIKNYQFVYTFFNDAGPVGPVKITIKENKIPVIEKSDQYNEYSIGENISEIYNFINETFDFIETVKNGTYNGHKIKSLTLNIIYDTQNHYPKEVNFSIGYVEMVDGGAYYTLKITSFNELSN